jgi:hypothetical protein
MVSWIWTLNFMFLLSMDSSMGRLKNQVVSYFNCDESLTYQSLNLNSVHFDRFIRQASAHRSGWIFSRGPGGIFLSRSESKHMLVLPADFPACFALPASQGAFWSASVYSCLRVWLGSWFLPQLPCRWFELRGGARPDFSPLSPRSETFCFLLSFLRWRESFL